MVSHATRRGPTETGAPAGFFYGYRFFYGYCVLTTTDEAILSLQVCDFGSHSGQR